MNINIPNNGDYPYLQYKDKDMIPLTDNIDTIKPKWVTNWIRDKQDFPEEWKVYDNEGIGDDVTIDEKNNYVYLSGSSYGAYKIDDGNKCYFFNDAVLLKYDVEGNLLWSKILGAKADYWIGSCQMCEYNGDVYVSHTNSDYSIVLSKFDSFGNKIWSKEWLGNDYNIPMGMIDDNGYIYITGLTINGESESSYSDLFLLKYDTDGNEQWTLNWNNNDYNGNDEGLGLATDNNGYVYVVGKTEKTSGVDYGDVLLLKFNSEGKLKWKKVVNIYTRDLGTSIVIHDGFFYITGVTDYEFNIKKLFLIKYDLDGKQKWFKIWDKSDQNIGTDIVIDNEEIFVSGDCGIDSGAHQRFGMLLLKYNLDGDLILENTWPSKRNWGGNHTNSIISYNNNLYIAGYWDMRIIKCDHYGGNKNKNSIKKPSIIIINILKKFIDRLPVLKSIFY